MEGMIHWFKMVTGDMLSKKKKWIHRRRIAEYAKCSKYTLKNKKEWTARHPLCKGWSQPFSQAGTYKKKQTIINRRKPQKKAKQKIGLNTKISEEKTYSSKQNGEKWIKAWRFWFQWIRDILKLKFWKINRDESWKKLQIAKKPH